MTRGQRLTSNYGWADAERELADGLHPEVVAARLGENVAYVLEVADERGWPVCWEGPTQDQILNAHERANA
jgi:hypothetical protein